ncbi:MAG: tetratricopeptide repeat protein [Desulfuromonadaceae bacterium]|nr:tetratricopeptide repeat protein [Desulfuromonadaceae bacterium]MDD2853918.1 tetratricopeptide repeat protein [Desulfuromonadaceae bacterium]
MILLKLCRNILLRTLITLVIISSLIIPPAFAQETEDSQVFIAGFNAYQQKDYASSIEKMNEVLEKYPDTPLRDMAMFWLSRSYYKAGNQQEAARYLSQFSKEYPDNPLKSTVEDELLDLTARFEKGEKLSVGTPPAKQPDRLAAKKAKAEKERIAAEKAEEAKRAAAAAETARVAALKQLEENAAAEKKELQRIAAVKAEQERIALVKAEEERIAAAAAEAARVDALKDAEERAAAAKKEDERLATLKNEQERVAENTTRLEREREKAASIKAEETRRTAENAELQRIAAAKAEEARIAAAKEEEFLRAAADDETARLASQKAEREQTALAKAEDAKRAAAVADAARLASLKAEEDRKAAELIAKEEEKTRLSALKAEELRLAEQKRAEEKSRATKLEYRERAISQYKSIIDKFPTSAAAATAAAKLREMGVAVALPPAVLEEALPENAQILRLEVAQFAGFEFNLLSHPDAFIVGQPVSVPFEIINRGNGSDSFSIESAFPASFKARFASAAEPSITISETPLLGPGETFRGVIDLVIPPESIDGLRITHPVKTASRLMAEASQSREIALVASAPLLRAVLRTEKSKLLPGEKVSYRIAVLNVGSTTAQNVKFRLSYPPQFEPLDYAEAGFKQEMNSALVFDGLQVKSGESREFSVAFRLKNDSLAGQELSTRAELINSQLNTNASFVSNMAYVESQHGIMVRSGSEKVLAVPGQTITVPFVVTNNGNVREKFSITSNVTGAQDAIVFNDMNRDGIQQTSEPVINEIGPLAPREEASIVVKINTPRDATDGSKGSVKVSFVSEGDVNSSASGSTQLFYSRPVLKMLMAGHDGRLKPGDVASFELTIVNNGSNLARIVELQSAWPEQLELIAAEPANTTIQNGSVIWRFKEVGASEKRVIRVSFRVKPVTGVGTAIQVKNVLTYEDQLGNKY